MRPAWRYSSSQIKFINLNVSIARSSNCADYLLLIKNLTKPVHEDLKIDGTIRPWTITAPRASLVLSPKEGCPISNFASHWSVCMRIARIGCICWVCVPRIGRKVWRPRLSVELCWTWKFSIVFGGLFGIPYVANWWSKGKEDEIYICMRFVSGIDTL